MGNIHSCTSKGALLLVAAANGDLVSAQELLAKHPKAASYYNFKDRSSPLLQAAARGHFELVQLILETAVMTEGPERAKKNCIDHANSKRQTALMVACKHGHPDCVEYLVTNGGDPLLTDERRHNTCLHFAALYGHSECVHKLLGSRGAYRVQGRQAPVAQIPCVDDGVSIKFIDRHNGWGLSALHIAVFQGSVSTVRALIRHGADVESVICASKVENSPIRCAVGSNALHIAALTGNIIMAKLILETQESYPGLELRSRTNAAGLKPHDYAQSARNPVLMHLLDERLPVTLLRQIWMNYSLEQSLPPRTQTLGSMLQKLKLMFNLELIAIQRNVTQLQAQQDAQAQAQQQQTAQALGAGTQAGGADQTVSSRQGGPAGAPSPADGAADAPSRPVGSLNPASSQAGAAGLSALCTHTSKHRNVVPANVRLLWARRQDEITQLLATVSQLHDNLKQLCRREEPPAGEGAEAAGALIRADRAATYEAVLDFILSTLINPRTVSAILHAAKKLVSASVNGTAALTAGGAPMELPPGDSDSQHGLALLSTALRAVETCLQAAVYLTSPGAMEQHAAAGGSAIPGGRFGILRAGNGTAAGAGGTGNVHGADPVVAAGAGGMVLAVSPTEALIGAADTAAGFSPSTAEPSGAEGARQLQAAAGDGLPPGPAASAVLVSDPATVELNATGAQEGVHNHGTPRAVPASAVGSGAAGVVSMSTSALLFQQAAIRGLADATPATPAFAAHWSAHLHTLIAQLQWDIGVQRHRRRRAHAAAAAARSAAAAVVATTAAAAGPSGGAPALGMSASTAGTAGPAATTPTAALTAAAGQAPAGVTLAPAIEAPAAPGSSAQAALCATAGGTAAAGVTVEEESSNTPPPPTVNLLRVLNSRRGDAVQDVVTSQNGTPPVGQALAHSRSDSGVSTPMAAAAGASAAAAEPTATSASHGGTAISSPEQSGPGAAAVAGVAPPVGDEGPYNAAHMQGIQTDEIIPLVSGVLAPTRINSLGTTPSTNQGGERGREHAAAEDHLMTGGTTAVTGAAGAGAKRNGAAKDRGKERDGAPAGDGGLDGQDDSPAASESGSDWSDDDRNVCSICMDLPVAVLVAGCQHGLCVQCAFQLCVKGRELPSCPFCRQKIGGFEAKDMGTSAAPGVSAAAAARTAATAAASIAVAGAPAGSGL